MRWFCGEIPDRPADDGPRDDVVWRPLSREETEAWVSQAGQSAGERRMHATALESRHRLWVAEQEERIIGHQWVGGGWAYLPWPIGLYVRFPEDMAFFYDAFVEKEYRCRGIRSRGLRLIASRSRALGLRRISAWVELSNHASLKTWARLGVPYWDCLHVVLTKRSLWLGGGGSPWARLGVEVPPRRLPPTP
jgi:GNAT superfamily N-acetyltransferase